MTDDYAYMMNDFNWEDFLPDVTTKTPIAGDHSCATCKWMATVIHDNSTFCFWYEEHPIPFFLIDRDLMNIIPADGDDCNAWERKEK